MAAAVVVAVLAGAVAGWGIRLLLARLRRGVVLPRGVAETAAAVVSGMGAAVAWGEPTIGLVLLAGLLMVSLGPVDILRHRLPDAITLVALPVSALTVGVTRLLAPTSGSVLTGAGCALVLWAVF